MKSKPELIISYIDEIRRIINSKVQRIGTSIKKNNKTTKKVIQEQLRTTNENYWGFICTSMDLIGDTAYAIKNIEDSGFYGPTKIKNWGELYLRLFGFLTSIYLQQNTVITLFKCLNVPGLNILKTKIEKLKLRDIRNKIASHNTDYLIKHTNEVDTYNFNADSLDGGVLLIGSYTKDIFEEINIFKELKEHYEIILDSLDAILEKIIKTIYKPNKEKQKEFLDELELLRSERKGNLVIRLKK